MSVPAWVREGIEALKRRRWKLVTVERDEGERLILSGGMLQAVLPDGRWEIAVEDTSEPRPPATAN